MAADSINDFTMPDRSEWVAMAIGGFIFVFGCVVFAVLMWMLHRSSRKNDAAPDGRH
jgi:uncharacterized membrane protein